MSIDPGTGTYGAWIAYAASSPITLSGADGTKTVRVQYRDTAGNVLTPDRHDLPRRDSAVHHGQHHCRDRPISGAQTFTLSPRTRRLGCHRHVVAARRDDRHVELGHLGSRGAARVGYRSSHAVLVLAGRRREHRGPEVTCRSRWPYQAPVARYDIVHQSPDSWIDVDVDGRVRRPWASSDLCGRCPDRHEDASDGTTTWNCPGVERVLRRADRHRCQDVGLMLLPTHYD